MSFQEIAGISGIAFAVLLAANFLGQGSPPAVDSSQADIVRYLVDSGGGIKFSLAAGTLALIPGLFWAAGVLSRLRSAGGDGGAWGITDRVLPVFRLPRSQ